MVQTALLRGINVGKAKRVGMADLRGLFETLGYKDVKTLLNSGNVVFSGAPVKSESKIEAAFAERFGFTSRITVIAAAELAEAVEGNPIREIADPSRFLVAFLKTAAHREHLLPLSQRMWEPETLALGARTAYLWLPGGVLQSPLNDAIVKALGDSVTARNWTTVLKLRALANAVK